ncbi:hypothetical protein O181_070077 [Austropuccinia psidii MF-1]|uniref:Reverse transcriptase Ty1/copia-type domain-containing protein n=1 Tax=Austropuccinia psidii MF-1 TaxID=1389203 RepID=A0A9Q3F2I0_9BASI|nr:hypothetical protein [Austropuccinia psidii MF-1]
MFPRKGNLYVSQFQPLSNSIIKESTTTTSRDWHIILGHPSNEYLKLFLQLNGLKKSVPLNKPIEGLPCTTSNNSFLVQPSQVTIIPSWPYKNNITSTTLTIPDDRSPTTPIPSSEPTTIVNPEPNQIPLEPCATLSSPSCIPLPQKKGYTYVPHYHNAPKDINSNISRDNIITEPRRQRNAPKVVTPPPAGNGDLYLNKEFQDPNERKHWKEAMDKEFELLTSKNTGTLVPPMSIDKYKERWVCFGNHQEHMVNYYDTYAAVARLESFKILLSLMVNRKYSAYQFDVETAFLYGEMDAPNYVSQVANYDVPDSVSADTDECLFFNTDRTLFLHIHVDDAFIIGETAGIIKNFLNQLSKLYSIKMKKKLTQHLGYTLSWKQNGSVILHQQDF